MGGVERFVIIVTGFLGDVRPEGVDDIAVEVAQSQPHDLTDLHDSAGADIERRPFRGGEARP